MTSKNIDDKKAMAATAGADSTAIATKEDMAVANTNRGALELDLPAEFLAGLSAEIESGLKALSIEKLTASRELLNKPLALVDAYTNVFNFNDPTERFEGLRVVFELVDEQGVVYTVAKSPQGSNLRFVDIYNAARKAQRSMVIPYVSFQEKGNKRAGNYPVVLCLSPDSKPVFN